MCYHVDTMTTRVGIRELRQQASRLLQRVAGGEPIEITDRGRPVARIVPIRPSALDQLVLEGRATAPTGVDFLRLAGELGLPAKDVSGASPSAALAELRSDER